MPLCPAPLRVQDAVCTAVRRRVAPCGAVCAMCRVQSAVRAQDFDYGMQIVVLIERAPGPVIECPQYILGWHR
eukprot:gene10257-biopygen7425